MATGKAIAGDQAARLRGLVYSPSSDEAPSLLTAADRPETSLNGRGNEQRRTLLQPDPWPEQITLAVHLSPIHLRDPMLGPRIPTGTHASLVEASHFVQILEQRQGLRIACPEEIALRLGYISLDQFHKLAQKTAKSSYGEYLLSVYRSLSDSAG